MHKDFCKDFIKKQQVKKEKAASKQSWTTEPEKPSHGLTEEQMNNICIEAFLAKGRGVKYSIEECAWQLGEHPVVIGGGTITYTADGEELFEKGDVAKIYRERKGVEWDGSPRFGMRPYVQQKPYFDLIAKAKQGKTMKEIQRRIQYVRLARENV